MPGLPEVCQRFGVGLRTSAVLAVAVWCLQFAAPHAAQAQEFGIWTMKLDGSELRRVVRVPSQVWHNAPVWSPDGKWLAFSCASTWAGPNRRIYRVRPDEPELEDLGPGNYPTWTPDSKQLVFSMSAKGDEATKPGIWIMNADGQERKRLFPGAYPSCSPNGKHIAYCRYENKLFTFCVYDVQEEKHRTVVGETWSFVSGLSVWSPDGKRLALGNARDNFNQLVLVDPFGPETGNYKTRHRGCLAGSIGWGPGNKILLTVRADNCSGPHRLTALAPDSDEPPVLLPHQDQDYFDGDGSFSPDGQSIVFYSNRPSAKSQQ